MDSSFAERLQMLSIQLVPFVMAVSFHEYAHGFIANRWGDSTAKDAGRLTLNPIPHMDPIGTVLFPVINMLTGMNLLFGWAKPVPIDPRRFRKFRPGLFWVSLAGPGMNFLLAIVSAVVFCCLNLWMPQVFLSLRSAGFDVLCVRLTELCAGILIYSRSLPWTEVRLSRHSAVRSGS